jgi:hypothetical protein
MQSHPQHLAEYPLLRFPLLPKAEFERATGSDALRSYLESRVYQRILQYDYQFFQE